MVAEHVVTKPPQLLHGIHTLALELKFTAQLELGPEPISCQFLGTLKGVGFPLWPALKTNPKWGPSKNDTPNWGNQPKSFRALLNCKLCPAPATSFGTCRGCSGSAFAPAPMAGPFLFLPRLTLDQYKACLGEPLRPHKQICYMFE